MSRRDRRRGRSRKKKSRRASAIASPYALRLAIERLEDRRMLATITVNSPLDNFDPEAPITDGAITLREAILAANADAPVGDAPAGAGADSIRFGNSLSGQTITLAFGELSITDAITIDAKALAENVTIDANQQSRIINIDDPSTESEDFDATLAGLTFTGGLTTGDNAGVSDNTFSGGAIRSLTSGDFTIDQSTISGNSTAGSYAGGGGVFSYEAVTVLRSTVDGNSTAGFRARGGGIHSYGDVTLTQSTFSGNSTTGSGADGGGLHSVGAVTLNQSTIAENSTTSDRADGAGINSLSDVTLFLSTVSRNITRGGISDGGGIRASGNVTISQSIISGNSTLADLSGGGGISSSGNLTLNQSTLSGNNTAGTSGGGGGIYVGGDLSLNHSTVSGNSTGGDNSSGGGILAFGALTLNESTVSANNTTGNNSRGGGIYTRESVILTQSTISGNSTAGSTSDGGGMYVRENVTLIQSTLSSNHALYATSTGGGVWTKYGSITAMGSIVSGNTAVSGMSDIKPAVGLVSMNHSLIGTSVTPDAGTSGNNIVSDDPMLGPLFNNGGPTLTQLPLADSPVLDHIPPGAVPLTGDDAEFDQRGMPFLREYGAGRDIGAVELQPNTGSGSADFNSDGDRDGIDFLYWQRGFGLTAGAAQTDGDATDDGDVDKYDLKAWETTLGPQSSADFDLDGDRDGLDFLAWQRGFGTVSTAYPGHGDANYDGSVTSGDFATWEAEFGLGVAELAGGELLAISDQPSAFVLPQAASTAGTRTDLIDAALAVDLMQAEPEEEAALVVEQPIAVEVANVSAATSDSAHRTTTFADALDAFLARSVEEGESVVPWLMDEEFDLLAGALGAAPRTVA